mmetsp:Transcript_24711/g.59349  ORF Transcript_24711/g.59349 Transcript_24711/m.59349 type:complete len:280 (+) Transcript_24711:999-1838(+)
MMPARVRSEEERVFDVQAVLDAGLPKNRDVQETQKLMVAFRQLETEPSIGLSFTSTTCTQTTTPSPSSDCHTADLRLMHCTCLGSGWLHRCSPGCSICCVLSSGRQTLLRICPTSSSVLSRSATCPLQSKNSNIFGSKSRHGSNTARRRVMANPSSGVGLAERLLCFFLNTPLWLEAVLAGIGSLTLKLRNPGTGVTSDTVSATIQRVHGHVLVAGERHFKVAGPEMDMKDRDPVLRPAQEVFGMDRYWQGHQPGASRHCLWSRAAAGVQMAGLRQVDC